jgi:hypothetical protein
MQKMKVPYDVLTLKLALLEVAKKIEEYCKVHGEKAAEELVTGFADGVPSDITNPDTAAHHGITVEQLINSPNYSVLKEEYREHLFQGLKKKVSEAFGLTDKETWAMVLAGQLDEMEIK